MAAKTDVADVTTAVPLPLTEDEENELGELEDLGSWLTVEQSTRYWELLQRKCPPPPPEFQRKMRERLKKQDIDFEAAYASFNAGDLAAVRRFLSSIAVAPKADVRQFERRINAALRAPMPRARERARSPRREGRRAATRARARAPSREDDPEPEPPRAAERASRISTLLEIDLLFADRDTAEAKRRVVCGYCGGQHRGPYGSTVDWFLRHACRVDERLERRNRAIIAWQTKAAA